MTPYYEHAGITIYHGDCRDVLPRLPMVDLLLSDPPYGVAYQTKWRSRESPLRCAIANDGDMKIEIAPPAPKSVKRTAINEVLPRSFVFLTKRL